ncbi:MAG: hypothetical protein AAF610_13825 [Pseudomonadota bacterium]
MPKKKHWRERDPESSREAARYEHPIPSRTLILDVLKIHPSKPGLELAKKAIENAHVSEQAKATVKAIEQKVKR